MELKEIQDLIKFVAKSGASSVDLEMDGVKISIKSEPKNTGKEETVIVQQVPVAQAPAPVVAQAPASAPAAATPATPAASPADDESKYLTIKSPMIGTFYRKPSPDKDLFVNVGDSVTSGTVVCVIEAMKLFNEIESEISGKIVKVLVDDATPVEFDQPLFLVDPS